MNCYNCKWCDVFYMPVLRRHNYKCAVNPVHIEISNPETHRCRLWEPL